MGRKRGRGSGARGGLPRGEVNVDTGVVSLEGDGAGGVYLLIDGAYSSHLDLEDPLHLRIDYMRWIAALIDHVAAPSVAGGLKALHLGGAGCTLPRYVAHRHPGSQNAVVEIDGELARLAREWFELPKSPAVKIRVGDARKVVDSTRPGSKDVVVRDAFAGGRVPESLLTTSFYRRAAEVLNEGGLYAANCAGAAGLGLARDELAGMATAFEHLAVVGDSRALEGKGTANLVLAGSNAPLPEPDAKAGQSLARALKGGELPAFYRTGDWPRRQARLGAPRG